METVAIERVLSRLGPAVIATVAIGVCLLGCLSERSIFSIKDPGNKVESAITDICGTKEPLRQSGDTWTVSIVIVCEGDNGQVVAKMKTGEMVVCGMGYVTPDREWSHAFEIIGGRCYAI